MTQPLYQIQCRRGSGWQTVGHRHEADALRTAETWTTDSGVEHRVLDPDGRVYHGAVAYEAPTSEEFRATRYWIHRRQRGLSEDQAGAAADVDLSRWLNEKHAAAAADQLPEAA